MRTRKALKVGDVARRTGITVRALHHYDEIGLLEPSEQTASGHRLYTEDDLARLQKVVSLRQLGFSLDEIAKLLRGPASDLSGVLERHIHALRDQVARAEILRGKLESMAARLRAGDRPTIDDLLSTIKETAMYEKYFTAEQAQKLKDHHRALGPGAQQEAERAWKQLAAEVRAEFDRGTSPTAPEMQALARQWRALIDNITGGDTGIRQGLVALHRAEPNITTSFFGPVVDEDVLKYIGQAVAALPTA